MRAFLPFLLFVMLPLYPAFSDERDVVALSIDEVISAAKDRDIELKSLTFSLRELLRSKRNLYRSLFPALNSSVSGTNILSRGEADTRAYDFSITLEQVLYNQLSAPIQFQNFDLSLQEARLALERRRWSVEQSAVSIYLDILLGEERLSNKQQEHKLYQKYLELMEEEYRIGSRTMIEVIETEIELLEIELELEELTSGNEVLYTDLMNLIGMEGCDCRALLEDDLVDIFSSLFFDVGTGRSFDDVYRLMLFSVEKTFSQEKLYRTALQNDFDIKKLRLAVRQNELKQKLLSIQFLDSISLSYGLVFTGERFFPANASHTIAINLFLDFGLLSGDVSLSRTSAGNLRSKSKTSESSILENLELIDEGRYLRLESYTTAETLEKRRKEIRQAVEIWLIKMNSLLKGYSIKMKQKEVFQRNEELLEVRRQIGELKEIDYFYFLIQKNAFLIELEELKYSFIILLWELENLISESVSEVAG